MCRRARRCALWCWGWRVCVPREVCAREERDSVELVVGVSDRRVEPELDLEDLHWLGELDAQELRALPSISRSVIINDLIAAIGLGDYAEDGAGVVGLEDHHRDGGCIGTERGARPLDASVARILSPRAADVSMFGEDLGSTTQVRDVPAPPIVRRGARRGRPGERVVASV